MPTAIVTGASQGFGLAVTEALAARNWSVVVDARHEEVLRAATAHLPGVVAIGGDISDPEHAHALVAAAGRLGKQGGLDLLINNASHLGTIRPLADSSADDLSAAYAVNVHAPLGLTRLALPLLAAATQPAVVMMSSDAATEAYAGWGVYGSSKAALDQLAAVLAAEHPRLRVYAFDPGDMRTAMHQQAFPGEDISDRPEPASVVPALLRLIDGRAPSGRYRSSDLLAVAL